MAPSSARTTLISLFALTLSGTARAGACGLEALTLALDASFDAYAEADLDGFVSGRDAARRTLACVDEQLPGESVAALHQLEALDAYLPPRNLERAVQSFHAARMASAAFAPSEALAPEGNLLREQWELSRERIDDRVPLYPPRGHRLYMDGKAGTVRAVNRPVIVQLVTGGEVTETLYLPPTALSPAWSIPTQEAPLVSSAATPGADRTDRTNQTDRTDRGALPLAVSAAGAAAISGGLWALALSSRGDLYATRGAPTEVTLPERHREAVEGNRATINTVGYAAQATAIVAAGLGAGALITWRW